jgi:branched-subunit amino acid transport protein
MTAWLVIAAVGVGTYAFRASMFVVLGRRALPAWTETPMALVAPAAIAALVASLVFTRDGAIAPAATPEVVAVLLGFLAVHRTGNVMHAFVVGMPAMWLLTAVLP